MSVRFVSVGLRGGPGSFADAKEFAASRGWRVCRSFSLAKIGCTDLDHDGVLDHLEYFSRDGKPFAIVSHTYKWPVAIQQFAEARGLMFEYIPYSWHNPETALGVIFTRMKS